jgi:hypothetical protein
MTDTSVERCARAVHEAIPYAAFKHAVPWERADQERATLCRLAARAVLAALREPSPTMIEAGLEWNHQLPRADLPEIWRAMLDAALTEGGER